MQLGHSKAMSMHVSACSNYNFIAVTPVVWKLWCWCDVCISTSRHKNVWSIFRATNQHQILCEIRKECKWHLCKGLRSLWERSNEKVLFL